MFCTFSCNKYLKQETRKQENLILEGLYLDSSNLFSQRGFLMSSRRQGRLVLDITWEQMLQTRFKIMAENNLQDSPDVRVRTELVVLG